MSWVPHELLHINAVRFNKDNALQVGLEIGRHIFCSRSVVEFESLVFSVDLDPVVFAFRRRRSLSLSGFSAGIPHSFSVSTRAQETPFVSELSTKTGGASFHGGEICVVSMGPESRKSRLKLWCVLYLGATRTRAVRVLCTPCSCLNFALLCRMRTSQFRAPPRFRC